MAYYKFSNRSANIHQTDETTLQGCKYETSILAVLIIKTNVITSLTFLWQIKAFFTDL